MSYDPFESEVNYPPHQKESRQPPLRELSLRGTFENDEMFYDYFIKGYYHDDGKGIRVIEHDFQVKFQSFNLAIYPELAPELDHDALYWILAPAIQDYLKITGTIHFDQKLEL